MGQPLRVLVWLAFAAVLLAIFREAQTFVIHLFNVLLLFVFAMVIAIVLTPVADLMQRFRPLSAHRALTVLLLYLLFVAILVGLGFLLGPGLVEQARHLPELAARFQSQFQSWGIPINLGSLQGDLNKLSLSNDIGLITGVVGAIAGVVLVVVISIYLMIEGRALIATSRNLFPTHARMFDFGVLAVGSTIEAYVRGQLLMSLIIGAYTAVTMQILGVHYALVLGLAAAILELLPIIGAVIALALAASIALLQSPGLGVAAVAVGVAGHLLEAYVIGPRVSGRVTQLHPLVAMSALLVGAEVGGILGALFGVPIAAVANIILGAVYRSHQGEAALSTHARGKINEENLPRLGDEIGGVDREGIVSDPVPREKKKR